MSDPIPPPTYSQTNPEPSSAPPEDPPSTNVPHVLIIPTGNTVNFQKGYLGAEGETAAIEGELQIKGVDPSRLAKIILSLRTVESANETEIELGKTDLILFSRAEQQELTPYPSSFPFAIPLTADTPQSVQTACSSLSHKLTASLHFTDGLPLTRTLTVHTKRYTSHNLPLPILPETRSIDEPTKVEVQLPRTTYKTGEPIPIYVTVPPPPSTLVTERGLRLRNVRAELTRIVEIKQNSGSITVEGNSLHNEGPSSSPLQEIPPPQPSSSSGKTPFTGDSSFKAVIARSGASCRFHSSRSVKLRFVLYQFLPSSSPTSIPTSEPGLSDAECPSITQLTLLHSITFQLSVFIAFVDVNTRQERISVINIPITMLAPPAPLPEVSPDIDAAYSKKHDRPPARTVREDDSEHPVPHYSEGEAGPSVFHSSAPPPFEERDAPPPFSHHEAEASTSSRLPSFLEAEAEIIIPDVDDDDFSQISAPLFEGEGIQYGFPSSEQFDGHTEPLQQNSSPPPSLEMASRDPDITSLVEVTEPQLAMEALGIVLDRHESTLQHQGELPPPPPAMDDPMDPPPSIDSDYRSPDMPRQATISTSPPRHASPDTRPSYSADDNAENSPSPPPIELPSPHGHAPPPYLTSGPHTDQENVARPPPYVD